MRSDQYEADRSSASSPMCVSLPDFDNNCEAQLLDEETDGGDTSSDGSFFDLEKKPDNTGSYIS